MLVNTSAILVSTRKTCISRHASDTVFSVIGSRVAHLLIADDIADWRTQVRSILKARPEWQVVGEASDGLEAVQKAAELKPEIVLLDVGMPNLNGIEAAQRIKQCTQSAKLIFVTQCSDTEVKMEALASGAAGFILKANAACELVPTIELALRNGHAREELKPMEQEEPVL